ncbi:MAG: glutamate--tRNA ligase, partial [Myxococcota bacterium]|nr:glutamate--tRNA ligase [Myxococcota bacterium]
MRHVRTRFAPSPTGYLHLGSARTALFNWAFARRHGGSFVLRVEDTDRERSDPALTEAILAGLLWLGLDWDQGPFHQSERQAHYDEAVERMLAAGRAYRCVCTPEELEARRQATIDAGGKWTYDGRCRDAGHGPDSGPHTVRLRLPAEGRLAWDDAVFGESGQDVAEVGDRIIRRSDGVPLYHLAVVVDDVEMGITHVIRGADHHINTALQLAIYDALGAEPPRFAHVPLLVGDGGRKLSKREGSVAVEEYREQGFLPEAMVNWLVRLGWSHGDQEIFSRDDVARLFDLDHVGRGAARPDPEKLAHLNQHWIKALPRKELLERLAPFLEEVAGRSVPVTPELERLVDLLRERSRTLAEMAGRARFAVVDAVSVDEKAAAKHLKPSVAPALADLRARLAELPAWTDAALEEAFG